MIKKYDVKNIVSHSILKKLKPAYLSMIIRDVIINNDIIIYDESLNRLRPIRIFDKDFVNGMLR